MSIAITESREAKPVTVTVYQDLLIALIFIGAICFGLGYTLGIKHGETNKQNVMEAKQDAQALKIR